MRKANKLRLYHLIFVVFIYTLGFQYMPTEIQAQSEKLLFILFSIAFFLVIPVAHWFCIIKTGKQQLWRTIVPFSLSSFVARYTFPEEIATYFEFITWLRYPLMAMLLAIEFYLMYVVIKGLWQARHLKGDPRIIALSQHSDDKKRSMAFMLATEPASWFYAIPRFSKNHPEALANLNLLSAKRWHFLGVCLALVAITFMSYWLVSSFSQWGAVALAAFVLYGLVLLTANYRISRHFSCYISEYDNQDKQLVINNSVWGLLCVPIAQCEKVEKGQFESKDNQDSLFLGRGEIANVKITFSNEQVYQGAMGQIPEAIEEVFIHLDEPSFLLKRISESSRP
ncbi:hypothetical protein J3L16_03085 [Alteromonas sp. 5E99-2]|uniref:hypothetical protein n=1 Tax=Alteromonas sp. 5E99-2 TaxID=2817683 RepID=UPI001A99704E|nr:hypothetical protein [Alteromonas sp. 5E99-2]MBO1254669.1 hypothetical protein [Alteromonas sp. 5E99-2]